VQEVLGDFVEAARGAFGPDLRAVVLYGSAAEGRLRATSDVNVILVLGTFDRARAEALREPMRVRVNAVCPGVIKNERWSERIAGIARARGVSEEELGGALARENVPLGRLGTQEDVAPVVVFLASPVAAAYITGVSVDVDGGLGRGVAIRGAG